MHAYSPPATLSLLSLPTEILFQIMLAVDEPWAIHHTTKPFLAISKDEYYRFSRDTTLPPGLVVWSAIKRRGPLLSPEYLQRLLDFGAPVPTVYAQLLTNARIPRSAPARALHATLAALPARTRALLVAAHIRTPSHNKASPTQGFVWDRLVHDDDQRVFESLFGAPSSRFVSASARALFDTRGFVPFCGGRNDADRGVGSLEGAFDVAFKYAAQTPPNFDPLLVLLSSNTIRTLISTNEQDLKSRLLVNSFAIAGTQCASRLMQQPAFWRPRLNVVEALLRLTAAEQDLGHFMNTVTASTPLWPPHSHASRLLSSCSASRGSASAIQPPSNWLSKPEHTIHGVAEQLLAHIDSRAEVDNGSAWLLKHHASLGRIYAYYNRLEDDGRAVCASLESLGCAAVDELFSPKKSAERKLEGKEFEKTAAWTLYENFGARPRSMVLRATRAKVEQLFKDQTFDSEASTFAEWGLYAYLIARLDAQDREHLLARTKAENTDMGSIESAFSDNTRRKLLSSGLPLAFLGVVA